MQVRRQWRNKVLTENIVHLEFYTQQKHLPKIKADIDRYREFRGRPPVVAHYKNTEGSLFDRRKMMGRNMDVHKGMMSTRNESYMGKNITFFYYF